MEDCQVNDENTFTENAGIAVKDKVIGGSDKNPLKPLNDASRLSGNLKELSQEKTPQSSPFGCIRQLDSAERWIERNRVVIKGDHMTNDKNAEVILKELVKGLPIGEVENKWVSDAVADDLIECVPAESDLDKLSDLLGGLDISPSVTGEVDFHTSKVTSKNLVDSSPLSTKEYVKNAPTKGVDDDDDDDDDDEIQFGKQISCCPDTKSPLNAKEINSKEFENIDDDDEIQFGKPISHSNFESENPFTTKSNIVNSPITNKDKETSLTVKDKQTEQQFSTKDDILESENPVLSDQDVENEDPFAAKSQIMNSPMKNESQGPFATQNKMVYSPTKIADEDQVKYIEELDIENPFATKNNVNSPMINEDKVSSAMKSANPLTSDADLESQDPFATKNQIVNSPVKNEGQEADLSTKDSNIVIENAFAPKSTAVNSPMSADKDQMKYVEKLDSENPFATKNNVVNSPMINEDKVSSAMKSANPLTSDADLESQDPFATKNQIVNSPVKNEGQEADLSMKDSNMVFENAFAPKSTAVNSPMSADKDQMKYVEKLDSENPFATKNNVVNSPMINEDKVSSAMKSANPLKSNADLESQDPFATKNQIVNSPVKNEGQEADLSTKDSNMVIENAFAPKSTAVNSPMSADKDQMKYVEKLDSENPFATKNNVVNSPMINEDKVSSAMKSANPLMSDADLESQDPFATKNQIVNSPVKNEGQESDLSTKDSKMVDPFSTQSNISNSPIPDRFKAPLESSTKIEVEDPFATKSQILNSPLRNESEYSMVDPFSTQGKITNSPVTNKVEAEMKHAQDFEIKDPFVTQTKIAVSPMMNKAEEDSMKCSTDFETEKPFATNSKIMNSPVSADKNQVKYVEELDTEKSNIMNSPMMNEGTVSSTIQCTNPLKSDTNLESKDPFATKSQIVNSPVKNEGQDPLQSVTDLEMDDPFSDQSKIANSPVTDRVEALKECAQNLEIENPSFACENQIINSPVQNGQESILSTNDSKMVDPFSTQSKIANSPILDQIDVQVKCAQDLEIKDPFATQTKIAVSPMMNKPEDSMKCSTDFETENSFTTNSKIMNSPVRNENEHPMQQVLDVSVKELENTDVFTEKGYVMNSPMINEGTVSFKMQCKSVNAPLKNNIEDSSNSAGDQSENQKPFTKSKIGNSPVKNTGENQTEFDTNVESKNPFSTKSKIVNSPVKNEIENTIESTTNQSIQDIDIQDPFTTKCNIVNSPITNKNEDAVVFNKDAENVDKLSAQSGMTELDMENPFRTKGNIANSPMQNAKQNDLVMTRLDNADKSNIEIPTGNSDTSDDDDDDFKSFENSPVKKPEEDLTSVKCSLLDSPSRKTAAVDLFQAKDDTIDSLNSEGLSADVLKPEESLKETKQCPLNIDDLVMAMKNQSLCKQSKSTEQKNNNPIPSCDPNVQGLETDTIEQVVDVAQIAIHDVPPFDIDCGNISKENKEEETNIVPIEMNAVCLQKETQLGEEKIEEENTLVKPLQQDNEFEVPEQTLLASSTTRVDGGKQTDMETFSEAKTDNFEDEFEDATEVFHSAAILSKVNKDFAIQQTGKILGRESVLFNFDPLAEKRESLLINRGSPKRPTRVSEIFKGSIQPSDDGVNLFGTPPKKPHRRAGFTSRIAGIAKDSIEEEQPSHQVDMMLNLEAHETMKDPVGSSFPPATPRLVDFENSYTESAFRKLKNDLTLHYEERMLQKDKDCERRLQEKDEEHNLKVAELEAQISTLSEEKDKLSTTTTSFKAKLLQFRYLCDGYLETITKLLNENKMLQSKITSLKQDGDQSKEDFLALDRSFDDLFHRYEKMKNALENTVKNHENLKTSLEQAQEKYKEKVEATKKMKELAETKLAEQEEQIEKLSSSKKAEAAKLEVVLKRKEMEIQSLKNAMEQKKAENAELTEMCDSLINKVSGK